ncbi:MAG TPA: gamma carbonic anhydrase family protein [Nocardioidaceae bacterium]|nr:gamma carbonic anhydrase family protein [Nocardioidaceae bacterium]
MSTAADAWVLGLEESEPEVAPGAWVAPGATVVGTVRLAEDSSVWYGAVLRGDGDRIELGPGSNVQDGSVLHADPGLPTVLGSGVTVGHRAVVHGARIGNNVLIGMGAIVLNGCRVGDDCLIAAGAVLLEGTEVRAGSLVVGTPGRVRRSLTAEEIGRVRVNAEHYVSLARRHASAAVGRS